MNPAARALPLFDRQLERQTQPTPPPPVPTPAEGGKGSEENRGGRGQEDGYYILKQQYKDLKG